ncbi:MAG: RNase adapter RapZ [Clostridia bacterium]|jgi:UPF0042 nucleotide-binding protein|nr:RNase adapter RapZ [Clostridia bacterium]
MSQTRQLVIVTGMSGAGKTQAVRSLEDLGFFCVDNLPPVLLPRFVELLSSLEQPVEKAALVMDVRGGAFFDAFFEALEYLDESGYQYEILFLEASEEALVRRFKETRRRHPLSLQGSILESILQERERLAEIKGRASKIIDTSELSTQQLKSQIADLYGPVWDQRLAVTVMSFGYKYGVPLDADLVVDVRFLPNPYYEEHLRPLSGEDAPVKEYVLQSKESRKFLEKFTDLLLFLLPYYAREGKSHLVIAIGCTGGQHRSVTLAGEIARALAGQNCRVSVAHRDLEREQGAWS